MAMSFGSGRKKIRRVLLDYEHTLFQIKYEERKSTPFVPYLESTTLFQETKLGGSMSPNYWSYPEIKLEKKYFMRQVYKSSRSCCTNKIRNLNN
jgi:hypothetical protein